MTAQMILGGDPNKLDVAGYAKGDVLAADATGILEPVTVGVDGTVLTADTVAPEGVDWQAGGGGGSGTPSNSVITETAFGQASNAGAAVAYSRGDHTHGTPAAPSVPSASGTVATETAFGQASNAGVAGTFSRGDHTHGTPSSSGLAPTANPTLTGTATFNRQITTPDVLTFASPIATDASLGNHFRVTLTGSTTLGAPTNPTDGQRVIWEIIQNGSGGNTLAYDAIFKFGPITPNTIASGANAVSYLGAAYSSARNAWDVLAFAAGY